MTVSKVMGLQSCNAMMEGQNSNFQNDLGSLLCVIGTKSTYFAGGASSGQLRKPKRFLESCPPQVQGFKKKIGDPAK